MTEGFAAIPNWMIRDETVGLYAIAVYTALASHAGPGGIHPSYPTLAREARCSESSVRRALLELEALGVVERVRRKSTVGRASNGYVLHPNGHLAADEVPVSLTDTPEVPVRGTGGSGQGAHLVPLTEEEPIEEEPINARAKRAALFEQVWPHWPRKDRKRQALEKFARLKPQEALEVARAIVAHGDAHAKHTPTQFVPHLITWLNRPGWEDPLPQPRMSGGRQDDDLAMIARARARDEAAAGGEQRAALGG